MLCIGHENENDLWPKDVVFMHALYLKNSPVRFAKQRLPRMGEYSQELRTVGWTKRRKKVTYDGE